MLGNRLKLLRKNVAKTQEDVATYLGITRGAYSHFENDRNEPDNEMLSKLSCYFHVSTDYLLGHTDDPTPVRDVNQDLYDEHNYAEELEALRNDEEFRLEFQDFDKWTDEEKRNILFAIRANRALREKNEEK